ncbi:MAG: hypothetical protein ACJ8HI_07325 [Massilia sp.]|jgi:hypothetical protein
MDPDNLFQILLGNAPVAPSNVLQGAPQSAPAQAAPAAEASPRPRRSLLDTIGRISDVLAKVGGADALYEPTLNAREDRTLKLGDHSRQVDADNIKLATDKFALGDAHNLRLGHVARGLQAIKTAGGDINQAWPVLAQRMQLDPETIESVGQAIANDPNALDGLIAATTDPKYDQSKYGGSVVYAKNKEGRLVAYQPSLSGDEARSILPDGVEPIDPFKAVDLGGSQALVGTRSGNPVRVLPKTERPGYRGGVPINERPGYSGGRPIAPAPGKAGTGPDPAMIETAQGNLDELRAIYTDLHKMGAMVSPAQAADKNVVARIRASGIGQLLEGAVGTQAQTQRDRVASIRPQLMQSLAKATGMTGKQLDSNADVKLFMQTVTNPATSYEANLKAIAGLERFLHANAKKNAAAAAPAARPSTVRPKPKDGWTIVGVK